MKITKGEAERIKQLVYDIKHSIFLPLESIKNKIKEINKIRKNRGMKLVTHEDF